MLQKKITKEKSEDTKVHDSVTVTVRKKTEESIKRFSHQSLNQEVVRISHAFRGLTGTSNVEFGPRKLCNKDRVQAPEATTIAFLPYKMFLEVWTASTLPVTSDLYNIKPTSIMQKNGNGSGITKKAS
jgi:hypothetical protein